MKKSALLPRLAWCAPWYARYAWVTSAGLGAMALAALWSPPADAAPRRTARLDVGAAHAGALSIGSPTEGRLVGGAHLEESPWLRVVPCYAAEDVRYGLDGLVSMIDHAARSVRKQIPDSVLSVGHLSRRGGGDLDRHASHESGRDADVGFYVTNEQGKSIYADHFVRFLGDGTAPSWPGARFDDARNWAFLASIVGDGRAHVSHVFIATPLRERLLGYAQRIGAPYAVRVRASEVMAQPRGALPHDDHFHVRISCPPGMDRCIEQPTRNIARAKRLHGRPRTTIEAPHPHSPPRVPAPPASATPPAAPTPPEPPAHVEPTPEELPPFTPPASLDAPIDDVDGVEE